MRLDASYLTDQLIPYIGNKRKLLPMVFEAMSRTGISSGTFFDVFSGSGVVSRLAKMAGFRVVSNDWEHYSEVVNKAYILTNAPPEFRHFGGLQNAIASLNALPGETGYIATSYCPADAEAYDVERERMFYTPENGRRIDAIRETLKRWREEELIDGVEEAVLLAPLIYQASYCSNTSGVFKGFHNGWGGATKTAWYRIRSHLTLSMPVFFDNAQQNVVLRADAADAAREVPCDIAYLDPPYNQHQYGANYHLLNTVALWDKPPIGRYISNNGKQDKAAIRKDWRTLRRSLYCSKPAALGAFADLIGKLQARFILVSYSTDGIIGVSDLLSILAERGELTVIPRQYKRYRVSSTRPSPRPHTVEFVAVVNTQEAAGQDTVSRAVSEIMASSPQ